MPTSVYNANNEELKRLREALLERSLTQNLEASRADNIAARDERVVAGEDTERGALAAANLAKQQLGGAAGGGAAALVGMEAAQKARNADFPGLLQRARDRKDIFEQKGVDRRIKAFDTMAQASSVEQARNRANAIAAQMEGLQKEWRELQDYIKQEKAKESEGGTSIPPIKPSDDGYRDRKPNSFVPGEPGESDDGYRDRKPNSFVPGEPGTETPRIPAKLKVDTSENRAKIENILRDNGFPIQLSYSDPDEIGGITADESGEHTYPRSVHLNRNQSLSDYIKLYPRFYDLAEDKSKYPNPADFPDIEWSDANLKEIYKGAGHNAGKKGNAKRSAKKNLAKAEEMFTDMGDGVNEILVERYGR